MKLQTKIPLHEQESNQIDYNSKLLLLGSCFVENIGEKLGYYKFQNLQNPFGIIFNPAAIERLVTYAITEKLFTENDIFFHNERWHCYDVHSELSSSSKEGLLHKLNSSITSTNKQIRESSHIIITLGTAWVYKHRENDQIVANCHKVPQEQFKKELLSIDAIGKRLKSIISSIHTTNPEASVILTVSPVRHLKDGFIQNQRSKAHLLSSVHETLEKSANCFYFPSYEIMMDELRDYRFYSEDMIHPNAIAVNYIWEKFKIVWIGKDAYSAMDEISSIQKGLRHKPFNTGSKEHELFRLGLKRKQDKLSDAYPHMNFDDL